MRTIDARTIDARTVDARTVDLRAVVCSVRGRTVVREGTIPRNDGR